MWQAQDHAYLAGEEVVVDEVLDDGELAVRFVGSDCVFVMQSSKLTKV